MASPSACGFRPRRRSRASASPPTRSASEYADPTAGVVAIITRPASKVYQAEGQVNLSDPMLNARNAFDKEQDSTRTGSFSGYAGGPIIPNRWSLLGYAGRWNRDDRLVVNATIARPGETVASPYLTRLPTPVHTNSRSLRTDVAASPHHILSAELIRFDEAARNRFLGRRTRSTRACDQSGRRSDSARLAEFGPCRRLHGAIRSCG